MQRRLLPLSAKINTRNMTTLDKLRKSSSFTDWMTPDDEIPTISASKQAPEDKLRRARGVAGSYTWVRPEKRSKWELISVSPSAMKDAGLLESEKDSQFFQDVMAGQEIIEDEDKKLYPWAQAYAGWQFGQWAGQLGDGRVISLFEGTNENTGKRYELQLKGAGLTPYSRFADGKAVLRSSIREALGSEAVYALGIPTTRALALVNLPETKARRETMESCAIVCRMAETWVRIGTFDFNRARGSRKELRKLADYCIKEVFGGEDKLVAPASESETRYTRLYREICLRNAKTLAYWQTYGYMNGVLNTDNTSVFGLTIDYGPYSFMDTFDASFTPNHDDGLLRYAYKNQPTAIWWTMVRLGEDLGELIGADPELIDNEEFVNEGLQKDQTEIVDKVLKQAEKVIESTSGEFTKLFKNKYCDLMSQRLGFVEQRDDDHDKILTPLLDTLQEVEADYNQFFRKLGDYEFFSDSSSTIDSSRFFAKDRGFAPMYTLDEAKEKLNEWLKTYQSRLESEGSTNDASRRDRMHKVNPKFVLKSWIMDEVIQKAKNSGDFEMYNQILQMSCSPFQETWGFEKAFEDRVTGDTPKTGRDIQCSCSS